MIRPVCFFSSISALFLLSARAQDRAELFASAVETRITTGHVVRGDDPEWYFPTREVKHLAKGRFWDKPWETVAENHSDPIVGILEFHALLKEKGVDLLLVPIPAKGSIYPDYLVSDFRPGDPAALAPFLDEIRSRGVDILDLEPSFQHARAVDPGALLYCRQDAHFSPLAAAMTAQLIAKMKPLGSGGSGRYTLGKREMLTFVGDLISGDETERVVPPESLPVNYVLAEGTVGVVPDPKSSVILLGDSHTLIFHEGRGAGMHCVGAGVLDLLALHYGYAPDLVGVRGSGMVQARKQLFYKASSTPGYWEGKKLVIWMFSVREFTQSTDKPVTIPLSR